ETSRAAYHERRPHERPHRSGEFTVTAFDQQPSACRCEWGEPAATALAPADVIICVDVAVARGAAILPHPWIHPHPWQAHEAIAFAHAHQAELASKRRHGRYSL